MGLLGGDGGDIDVAQVWWFSGTSSWKIGACIEEGHGSRFKDLKRDSFLTHLYFLFGNVDASDSAPSCYTEQKDTKSVARNEVILSRMNPGDILHLEILPQQGARY